MIQVVSLLACCLLGCLVVRDRREVSKDAGLLVLRHQNAVLRRQIGRVRYQPGGRLPQQDSSVTRAALNALDATTLDALHDTPGAPMAGRVPG